MVVLKVLICWPLGIFLFLLAALIGAFAVATAPVGLILLVPAIVAVMGGIMMFGMPFTEGK